MLINDNLIDPVLSIGALICGGLNTLCGFALAYAFGVLVESGSISTAGLIWGGLGFLIGWVMAIGALSVIASGVSTIFVCYAEDPEALARSKPDEYNCLTVAFDGRLRVLRTQQAQNANS